MNGTYLDADQRAQLLAERSLPPPGADAWQRHREYFRRVPDADFLNQMLYLDTKAFMTSLNLTYADKTSMAASVEVRVPFLDRDLAEFAAWHVPPQLKVHGNLRPTGKYILRRALRDLLPKEVVNRPKAGFAAPLDHWLAHDLREMVDDLLSERRIRERGYFEAPAVRRLVEDQRRGRHDFSLHVWLFLTFELWQQTFLDHKSVPLHQAAPEAAHALA